MNKISLTCKIITPLFMGGAEQQPELRTQSFNGLFRHWFRLLGGSIEDEKRLFGWGGEKARKGLVKVNLKKSGEIKSKEFEKIFDDKGFVARGRGINYLGFSLDPRFKKDKKANLRKYILELEGQNFGIEFLFYPNILEEDIKKFLCAVWCAFYLGNFGSRSRRGFGSIVVEEIEGDIPKEEMEGDIPKEFDLKFKPDGNEDISKWLKNQLDFIKNLKYWKARDDIPYIFENLEIYEVQKANLGNSEKWLKFVQQGKEGRFLVNKWALNSINKQEDLLDFMGFLLMAFRSYYQPDYNIAKQIIQNLGGSQRSQLVKRSQLIKRVIFGLPLNFYFSSLKRGGMVEAKLGNQTLRRASPLIFKIIQFGKNNFVGFILVFKPTSNHSFKFLPDEASINLKGVGLDRPNWEILDEFINSLKNFNLITKIHP
ncbi:MAG: type III-B CRISPR module RAMP protein Cmr1 [bacterium]